MFFLLMLLFCACGFLSLVANFRYCHYHCFLYCACIWYVSFNFFFFFFFVVSFSFIVALTCFVWSLVLVILTVIRYYRIDRKERQMID